MTKNNYHLKKIIWSFFIGIFLVALLLFAVYYLFEANTSKNLQSEFVEVFATITESNTQTAAVITPLVEIPVSTRQAEFQYLEVTGGCGIHFDDTDCLNVRSGPGTNFPAIAKLRNSIVLKVDKLIENEDGRWYKIIFDEWLRYPNRVSASWYISADHVRVFTDTGPEEINPNNPPIPSQKRILIDRGDQTLIAFDGEEIFIEISISTGLDLSPTPRGIFTVFRKTPTRYMQGPIPGIPGSDYYDLPGVPWNLYFTEQGAVIHGAYWHNSFGNQYSHGCVNLPTATAETLYKWADLGTTVEVRD